MVSVVGVAETTVGVVRHLEPVVHERPKRKAAPVSTSVCRTAPVAMSICQMLPEDESPVQKEVPLGSMARRRANRRSPAGRASTMAEG